MTLDEIFGRLLRFFQVVLLGMPDPTSGRNARKLLYQKIEANRRKR
jgi:hypothetical protein